MRLIGTVETEKQAYAFQALLAKEGIENTYEPFVEGSATHYRIWIYSEEDLEKATGWMQKLKEHPEDPKFQEALSQGYAPKQAVSPEESADYPPISITEIKLRKVSTLLTNGIILLCAFLFFWSNMEQGKTEEAKGVLVATNRFTSLQEALLFDFPTTYQAIDNFLDTYPLSDYKDFKEMPKEAQQQLEKIERIPFWQGAYPFFLSVKKNGWKRAASQVTLFEKIQKGEIWRFFTPCLLHRDFLHILFNMIWVWVLLKQIEARLSKWKICLLILCIGVISNTAQYLVSGPNFIGFSGVVVGLAGFIWMRQRKAPWEGYPLQKSTFLFLAFFVLAMLLLEIVLFSLKVFSVAEVTPVIANTAHIVGGLFGMLFGRLSFFARRAS